MSPVLDSEGRELRRALGLKKAQEYVVDEGSISVTGGTHHRIDDTPGRYHGLGETEHRDPLARR